MELLQNFGIAFFFYLKELFAPVVFGFVLSGLFYEFIPTEFVKKYLGQSGFRPIFISSFFGALLPLCCFGSLPVAIAMRQKGARLGPVLAFLVTTPATSVSALLITWKLLGTLFTIYIFFAVIAMGIIIGMVGNRIKFETTQAANAVASCCSDGSNTHPAAKTIFEKIEDSLRYAFLTLPKELGLSLLLGVTLASFITTFQPAQHLIKEYLQGVWGYAFGLIFGLATYVCSTGDVPLADAFVKSGMSYGPAMTYLIAGPITSYGMIFALQKEFGWKVLGLYLGMICLLSVLFGIGFNLLIKGSIF